MFPFEQLYNLNPKANSILNFLHTLETKSKIREAMIFNNPSSIKVYAYKKI